jgi:hypothetical protein
MAVKEEFFSSLIPCSRPPILIGDDTLVAVAREGRVELHNVGFENVLHVPNISMNMVSVYHITQKGKKVEFRSYLVLVIDIMTIPSLQLVRQITSQGCINSLRFLTMTLLL